MSEHPHPFTSRILRLHAPLVLGVAVCLYAGWFELTRARAGHTIAWVYVFEWPAFAVAGTVIWWRIVTGRDDPRKTEKSSTSGRHHIPEDDPGLRAWQRYRTALEQNDTEESSEDVG